MDRRRIATDCFFTIGETLAPNGPARPTATPETQEYSHTRSKTPSTHQKHRVKTAT
jgi:hypothetical protein